MMRIGKKRRIGCRPWHLKKASPLSGIQKSFNWNLFPQLLNWSAYWLLISFWFHNWTWCKRMFTTFQTTRYPENDFAHWKNVNMSFNIVKYGLLYILAKESDGNSIYYWVKFCWISAHKSQSDNRCSRLKKGTICKFGVKKMLVF